MMLKLYYCCCLQPEGQEWFYIPRPSLHTGTRRSSSEGSRYSSGSSSAARRAVTRERGVRNCLSLVHEQPTPACADPPGVHGVPSSVSSASSQVQTPPPIAAGGLRKPSDEQIVLTNLGDNSLNNTKSSATPLQNIN